MKYHLKLPLCLNLSNPLLINSQNPIFFLILINSFKIVVVECLINKIIIRSVIKLIIILPATILAPVLRVRFSPQDD